VLVIDWYIFLYQEYLNAASEYKGKRELYVFRLLHGVVQDGILHGDIYRCSGVQGVWVSLSQSPELIEL
jgi:hypothetical protein